MTNDRNESTFQLTTNRRNVLRTATGLAAVAVAGSAIAGSSNVASAQGNQRPAQIVGQLDDIGPFSISSFSWGMDKPVTDQGDYVGRVQMSAFTFSKNLDAHTTRIQSSIAIGLRIDQAEIACTDSRGSFLFGFTFDDVTIMSSDLDATTGENSLEEQVAFIFRRVTMMHGDHGYVWDRRENEGETIP